MSGFSSALKLTDLNDFIQPSQACIKPVESGVAAKKGSDEATGDEEGGIKINKSKGWKARAKKVDDDTKETEVPKTPLSVTLGDCLACSGCITSAEAVLIAEQSHEKVFDVLEKKKDQIDPLTVVVSLSLQSIASLAAKYRLPMQATAERLAYFFHSLGVDYTLDIALARQLCLVESAREFVATHQNPSPAKQTILSSTCPGFVCYAEKSQGTVLVPMLSTVKSPQQIMGLLVKKRAHLLAGGKESSPKSVYHITLMPCYDKKLEASRLDNRIVDGEEQIPEVDCVITPIEVEKMLEMKEVKLSELPGRPLDHLYPKFYESDGLVGLRSHVGSGAGGYAENIFRFVAAQLYGEFLEKKEASSKTAATFPQLSWKTIRNADFLELKLYENGTTDGDASQKVLLSFAILNGFRNVQNLVSRVKRKTCSYDYVEVSACPKGCLNGGAQLRDVPVDPEVNSPSTVEPAAIAFEQVQRLYDQLPTSPEFGLEIPQFELEQLHQQNRAMYGALGLDQQMLDAMRTKFQVVEKTFNILNSNW